MILIVGLVCCSSAATCASEVSIPKICGGVCGMGSEKANLQLADREAVVRSPRCTC
uniref:Uncharacterized protein n=1 Tax=Physcomitrium patens TaxID=3218 RepID=A0A2K1KK65_PHYPA|nr:hypothetical protein PHYPA_007843 [Physcomitrium patens]